MLLSFHSKMIGKCTEMLVLLYPAYICWSGFEFSNCSTELPALDSSYWYSKFVQKIFRIKQCNFLLQTIDKEKLCSFPILSHIMRIRRNYLTILIDLTNVYRERCFKMHYKCNVNIVLHLFYTKTLNSCCTPSSSIVFRIQIIHI